MTIPTTLYVTWIMIALIAQLYSPTKNVGFAMFLVVQSYLLIEIAKAVTK